jgi:hypothetical protein
VRFPWIALADKITSGRKDKMRLARLTAKPNAEVLAMTREEQIFEWMHSKWGVSEKGTLYQYHGPYLVGVFKKADGNGAWSMIFKRRDSEAPGFLPQVCFSEPKAKETVLNKLADAMKL